MEFYAGLARTTASLREIGKVGVRLDIDYFKPDNSGFKSNPMDICSASGLLLLSRKKRRQVVSLQSCRATLC